MGSLGIERKRSEASAVTLVGPLAGHPRAGAFGEVVRRVHYRYAAEVVGAFRLCPFMTNPASAFGKFIVVMDHDLSVDIAAHSLASAEVQVVHLIYPLSKATSSEFERFGNALHKRVTTRAPGGPVHAAFHPEMQGDTSNASKLVGLVRRAPDPFVQFVPEGLHEGGSKYVDLGNVDLATFVKSYALESHDADNARSNFERLNQSDFDRLKTSIVDIQRDRAESYAEFLDALGAA